jgi:serine/threonine protein kinase
MDDSKYTGRQISHYRLTGRLGQGGMGVVYRAEDIRLKRTVALKALAQIHLADKQFQRRFLREAQAASAINHPNICTIYDVVDTGTELFIVMEYVEGVTLRAWLNSRGRSIKGTPAVEELRAIDIIKQVCDGFGAAHDKGIIHRDVKPENIMFDKKYRVKVMDFGLAKSSTDSRLTKTGSTLGTLIYMAPEQLRGTEANRQSDIYSVGLVLYEALAGGLPFQADHEAALIYAKLNQPPTPLVQKCAGAQQELNRIVMKCIDREPDRRYTSLDELRADFVKYEESSKTKALPTDAAGAAEISRARSLTPPRLKILGLTTPRKSALVVGVLVTVVITASVIRLLVFPSESKIDLHGITFKELQFRTPQIMDPAISADRRWIAYIGIAESGHANIFIHSASGGDPKQLTSDSSLLEGGTTLRLENNTARNSWPSIVPNEDVIAYEHTIAIPWKVDTGAGLIAAFRERSDIKVVSVLGGISRSIATDADLPSPSWDGSRIAFESGKAVWSADLKGHNRSLVWKIPDSVRVDDIAWSHDGRRVALATSKGIVVLDTNGTHIGMIPLPGHLLTGLCWSSSGSFVVSSIAEGGTGLWIVGENSGSPQRLTLGRGSYTHPRMDASSTRLVCMYESKSSNLCCLDVKSGERRQLTFEDSYISCPWYSPDGGQLLYVKDGEFYVAGPSAEEPAKLEKRPRGWIEMSPAYPRNDNRFGGSVQELSPNRKYALVNQSGGKSVTTLVDTAVPLHPIRVFDCSYLRGHFSRGSECMVYCEERSNRFVRIGVPDGRESTVYTPGLGQNVSDFVVIGDGSQIVFLLRGGNPTEDVPLVKISRAGSRPEILARLPRKFGFWTISPDLSRVIYSFEEHHSRILMFENFRL